MENLLKIELIYTGGVIPGVKKTVVNKNYIFLEYRSFILNAAYESNVINFPKKAISTDYYAVVKSSNPETRIFAKKLDSVMIYRGNSGKKEIVDVFICYKI